jgi:hypothetical protein
MKKLLLTLATVGALAVPLGVVLADDDPVDPTEPVPTAPQPEQVRDRDHLQIHDPTPAGDRIRAQDCDCDGPLARGGLHDETCDGSMIRGRDQLRIADGRGDGPQMHQRRGNG